MRSTLVLASLVGLSLGGCTFDEGLTISDMTGTVVVPREAATRTFIREGGVEEEITDVRLIGPVYLGLYASVKEGVEDYPHPEVGPAYQDGIAGDTYPYGGTTVGDFQFACMEFLTCKVISGRYQDFDGIVSWFRDTLNDPITDSFGREVDNGDYLRQTCYEILEVTADDEVRLTNTRDNNDDGVIDAADLDFVENGDGDFEATFLIHGQEFVPGFSLWGWLDSPSETSYQFTTCDPGFGFQHNEYNNNFEGGRAYRDLLNFPAQRMSDGDYVASEGHVYETVEDEVVIRLDYRVGQ